MLGSQPVAIALLVSALFACPALHAAGLQDFTATYKLSRGALTIGKSRIALTREVDGGYHYESYSSPTRWANWFYKEKLHETSSGKIDANGFRPDKYHYLRTGDRKDRVAHLTFDWTKKMVVNNVAGSRWKMPVPAGTQDKLSTQLGMMRALARGETDFTFDIADGGILKKYRFRVTGKEKLKTPAGTFQTIKVTRLRGDDRRKTYAWCAPALGYLPVRIVHQEQDDVSYTSNLETFSESLRVVDKK